MASLRTYGAVLDHSSETRSKSAPVAELMAQTPRHRPSRRAVLAAAAAIVAVLAIGAGFLAARDRDRGPVVGTHGTTSTVPSSTTTTSTPSTPVAPIANVIVATSDGVLRFDGDGTSHRVVEGAVEVAVSDGAGGVVFQRDIGEASPSTSDTTLWHLAAGGSEPVAVERATGGEWLELWDVAIMNGEPVVVYSRHDAPSPQDSFASDKPADTLQVTGLATGNRRTVAKVGGWEWGPAALSAGGDRFALFTGAELTSLFEFRNIDGPIVSVPGNPFDDPTRFPHGTCDDDPTCPNAVAIGADGKQYAYIEPVGGATRDYVYVPDHYRIVVVDSATGRTVGTIAVNFPPNDQNHTVWVRSIDLTDDGTVIVNWNSSSGVTDSVQKPLVADLESGRVATMPVVGTAHAG